MSAFGVVQPEEWYRECDRRNDDRSVWLDAQEDDPRIARWPDDVDDGWNQDEIDTIVHESEDF